MREMLNTLLSFFRLDNGKEQPNISPCRISAITHILETEFTPIAMNKGLAMTITNQTDTIVLTDKERILQIGNNLLSNAIKFTENGGVSLTTDYDNGVLKLIVEDTGTGMTEKEQQRVFGAFERLSNAAAKDGFGLGLSIVQRIVTMLGGTIRLESEKGKGSRFTVEIPMQTAGELPERINQTRIHHDRAFHDVIAIDNDEVLLLMLKEMYAQEGVHCETCTDAAELMEMIRKRNTVYCFYRSEHAGNQRLRAAGTAAHLQRWQFKDYPGSRDNRFGQLQQGGTYGTWIRRMPVQTVLHIGTDEGFRQMRHERQPE